MDVLSKFPLEGLEFSRLGVIALPMVTAIQLNKYIYKNGLYEVYLIRGIQASFSTEIEAIYFLNKVSIKMNQCYRFLNWAYSKVIIETQPYYFNMDAPTRRNYTDTKKLIDQQFQLSMRTYANDNFQYFKKSEYIADKLLILIETGSMIPEVYEGLQEIRNVLYIIILNLNPSESLNLKGGKDGM